MYTAEGQLLCTSKHMNALVKKQYNFYRTAVRYTQMNRMLLQCGIMGCDGYSSIIHIYIITLINIIHNSQALMN